MTAPSSPDAKQLVRRLLGISLTSKLLIANGALAVLWVTATWWIIHHARDLPEPGGYPLLLLAATLGIALSVGANAFVLFSALSPVRELARVARAVERGDRKARVRSGLVRDPQTDQVVALTNRMLDALEAQQREAERAAQHFAQLSKREMHAREEERRAVARELVGDVGQTCTAITLGLHAIDRSLALDPVDREAIQLEIEGLKELARGVYDLVSRRAQGLRPSALDELGLVAALESAARRWSNANGVAVSVTAEAIPRRLSSALGITLYRVAEEAVRNAASHGRAQHVDLFLRGNADGIELRVVDDGRGFDVMRATRGHALGLLEMRQRMAMVGGDLAITSEADEGTTVRAVAPYTVPPLAAAPAD